jgi:hypothetical protein
MQFCFTLFWSVSTNVSDEHGALSVCLEVSYVSIVLWNAGTILCPWYSNPEVSSVSLDHCLKPEVSHT